MNMYLLRNLDSHQNSPTPSDRALIFAEATLDANGQAVLDLQSYGINPYANIYYVVLGKTSSYKRVTEAGEFGTAPLDITSFQVPVSLTAVPEGREEEPAVVIPAANAKVMVMLFVDPRDLTNVL